MAADLTAEVNNLTSYFKACYLMEEYGLSTDNVKTLEDAKKALRIYAGRRKGSRASQPVRQ